MRKVLCGRRNEGQVLHVFRPLAIRRRVGRPGKENGRLITIGYSYRCGRCGEPGYAA